MVSTRAAEVAEILWELKQAGKVATYSTIAKRAGFSAGTAGRAVITTMRAVRQDWPHLQWWRAVKDDGQLESGSEHEERLIESGFEVEPVKGDGDVVTLVSLEEQLMTWEEPEEAAADDAASK